MLSRSVGPVHSKISPSLFTKPDFSKLPPFDELVRIAFGPHGIINDVKHPVARALLGLPAVPAADDLDAEPL